MTSLTAVSRDGFTVNGGMTTYNNIDSLVAKYEDFGETSPFKDLAIKAFGLTKTKTWPAGQHLS